MPCHSCGRSLHDECTTDCETCHKEEEKIVEKVVKEITGRTDGGYKSADELIDRHSTGRKEAKKKYPIPKDHTGKPPPCEWQGKKNCGGGFMPIIGCINGRQYDRHHGPNKDTIDNRRENMHLICKTCHHRWHAVNDPAYGEDQGRYADIPHMPEPATEMELLMNDAEWRLKK